MKHLTTTLFSLFFFVAASFAQTETKTESSKPDNETDTLVVATQIYCNHCDQCGSCKPRIENALKTKKGIKSVLVNSKEKTIVVVYNTAKTDPASIRQSIAETGFDADDVKATKAGYDALDGCCKKH